jgi:hypothetical protein
MFTTIAIQNSLLVKTNNSKGKMTRSQQQKKQQTMKTPDAPPKDQANIN